MEFITTTTATSTSHQAAPPVAAPWRNESKLSWETKQPLLLRIRPTCAIFFCSIHGETRLFREHSRKTACVGPLTTHTHTHTARGTARPTEHVRLSLSTHPFSPFARPAQHFHAHWQRTKKGLTSLCFRARHTVSTWMHMGTHTRHSTITAAP